MQTSGHLPTHEAHSVPRSRRPSASNHRVTSRVVRRRAVSQRPRSRVVRHRAVSRRSTLRDVRHRAVSPRPRSRVVRRQAVSRHSTLHGVRHRAVSQRPTSQDVRRRALSQRPISRDVRHGAVSQRPTSRVVRHWAVSQRPTSQDVRRLARSMGSLSHNRRLRSPAWIGRKKPQPVTNLGSVRSPERHGSSRKRLKTRQVRRYPAARPLWHAGCTEPWRLAQRRGVAGPRSAVGRARRMRVHDRTTQGRARKAGEDDASNDQECKPGFYVD
jgi:hypothetical protein